MSSISHRVQQSLVVICALGFGIGLAVCLKLSGFDWPRLEKGVTHAMPNIFRIH